MLNRILSIGFIVLALAGCGQEQLPDKPQLRTDRDSIGFGQEYGSAVYVGQSPSDSLQIQNMGLEDLEITHVELTGSPAFTKIGPSSTTVKGRARTFITLYFKPTQVGDYSGELMIHSNAENAPMKSIAITGKAINP